MCAEKMRTKIGIMYVKSTIVLIALVIFLKMRKKDEIFKTANKCYC